MWAALKRELGRGEGQPPAERASLASALPGCSTSRQCRCLPPLPACTFRRWGRFSLWGGVVGADGLQHSPLSRRKRRSPCSGGRSPQPGTGHPAPAIPDPLCLHPPQPGLVPQVCQRASPASVFPPSAPRVPSLAADPPFPSPAFPRNPSSAPGLTKGGSTGLPSKQRWGPSPKRMLGGPLKGSLGRASLSGPFGPWPQGGPQSRHGRHLDGGRGRGLRAPRKGGRKNLPQRPPGSGAGTSDGPVGSWLRGHR